MTPCHNENKTTYTQENPQYHVELQQLDAREHSTSFSLYQAQKKQTKPNQINKKKTGKATPQADIRIATLIGGGSGVGGLGSLLCYVLRLQNCYMSMFNL